MLSSANCAILAAGNVLRSAGHFPSSAAVEGKRHFRFSPLRVAAGFVHARRDVQRFPPASIFPALAFTASLGHASTHEDGVSSPLLRPSSCPSLQGDVQSGDPILVSPLIHFTPLPLSAFLHTWRDLLGVSPWILRTIQFGYTLQFACN